MHFMALHIHGSSNPLGITGNVDRIPMHGYFVFKDLITVFIFLFVFSLFVFYSPNTLGQGWPLICAICWKYLYNIWSSSVELTLIRYIYMPILSGIIYIFPPKAAIYTLKVINTRKIRKLNYPYKGWFNTFIINYNKTIFISGLFNANPYIVKYYYNKYNQQITKYIYKYIYNINSLINKILIISVYKYKYLLYKVGISETIRTHYIYMTNSYKSNNKLCYKSVYITHINKLYKKKYINHNNIFTYRTFYTSNYLNIKNKFNIIKDGNINYYKPEDNNPAEGGHNIIINDLNTKLTLVQNNDLLNNKSTIQVDTKNSINLNKSVIDNLKFNEWLGGLIDGDGSLSLVSKKIPTCEITVGIEDEKMLRQIQNKYGGSIKSRSGNKSIKYKLQHKEGMFKLINNINGNIHNSKRLPQLHKLCLLFNIKLLEPKLLTLDNAWFSGYFDAKGSIDYIYNHNYNTINHINDSYYYPKLYINVINDYFIDLKPFKYLFNGDIYYDKSLNGFYKWSINPSQNNFKFNHLLFYKYNKINPSRSFKGKRLFLINDFYSLYDKKAFINLNDNSSHINTLTYNNWLLFNTKWYKNII